jgi:uncharacterized SAM-binding protein YcdF (DUF218 family)
MDLALFSRIAGAIITPSNFFLLLLVLGVLLQATRWRRGGRRLIIGVIAALLLIFFLPIDNWLAAPLENRFPRPPWPAHVDGMVVLGGGENGPVFAARGVAGFSSATGRLVAAAELARRYPDAKLIFSGGMAPFEKGMSEADVARAIFEQMGIPPSRLILEGRSRNTWENFVYSKKLARPQPGETWLVVTSATHMPRAMGIAAKLHWRVLPWPSDYSTTGKPVGIDWNSSLAARLGTIELAVHEWAGLAAYRLMGRLGDVEENSGT